jgi:DNA-binding transcriptional LysR family regulator
MIHVSRVSDMHVPVLPPIRGLQALSALAKFGSLVRAAAELGVTRSALSHRVTDLEAQLGVVLVRRAGRNIVLTEDAEAFLAGIGDALERIEGAVQPLRGRRSQVRVSTVATFASHWLIPHLPSLQSRHPEIEIAISTTRRPVDLDVENFDCAIRHGLGKWEGLKARLLFRETLVPVATPDVADRLASRGSEANFGSVTLIRARSRYMDWSVWWRYAGRPGMPPDGGIVVETRANALEAALAGVGIAMIDMAYVGQPVAEGRLRLLSTPPVQLSEGYYFVHRQGVRKKRLIDAVGDWLVEATLPLRSRSATLQGLT